ncbi:MAG: hypothetical protein QOF51_222 [Chloroflexota bacterium]|nr:hypothetical protein [Chloroflexota bacterium]
MARSADAAAAFARFAADLTYEALPDDVVATLKHLLLDMLGTTLAASTLGDGMPELLRVVTRAGGSPESTVIGVGAQVPVAWAAFANGGLAHALNYDDTAEPTIHVGAACIAAALAVGEQQGGLSGRELLAAVAAGAEVMVRLRLAIAPFEQDGSEAHPQPTQMLGYFGAALSAGRAMRLSARQLHSALGLASMQAAGSRQVVTEGRPAKALYAGFSALGGTMSALLSAEGVAADCAVFEGEAGLFATYYGGRFDPQPLRDGLGGAFHLASIRFKPWPVTGRAHPYIRAALRLRTEHQPDPAAIERVTIHGGPSVRTFCEPLAVRRRPRSPVEAEDSIPFAVAKSLANGAIRLEDLQPDGLDQPRALQIAERIGYTVDAALSPSLEVLMQDGARYVCPAEPGSETLADEDLVQKFIDCASHARRPVAAAALQEAIEGVRNLEALADCTTLVRLLSGIAP